MSACFEYKFFLFQMSNICSVPQSKSPCIRILGLFPDEESLLAKLNLLRADPRVNRLPILIGQCNKSQILGISLARAMHGVVVQERVREIQGSNETFEMEQQKAQLRRDQYGNREYGMTFDYLNRVLKQQNDMRTRNPRPAGWTAKQVFSYLLHNARAPESGFDRQMITQRLRDILERTKTKETQSKRVWTFGEESAKSLEEIDWDATVAKQLESMHADMDENITRDTQLQEALTNWPQDLRDATQTDVFVYFQQDLVEDAANWLEAMALGREHSYTVVGACDETSESMAQKFVKEIVLKRFRQKGAGILQFSMYEWCDLNQIDSDKIPVQYSDDTTQQLFNNLQSAQAMTQLIEAKARERKVKLMTKDTGQLSREMLEAAQRGDTVVPHAVTRVEIIEDESTSASKSPDDKTAPNSNEQE